MGQQAQARDLLAAVDADAEAPAGQTALGFLDVVQRWRSISISALRTSCSRSASASSACVCTSWSMEVALWSTCGAWLRRSSMACLFRESSCEANAMWSTVESFMIND
ncbi:hypothetical protein WKW80_32630 [Variovorax humicola]|uniref:Uncharacterized protein n=1 Tax=Variovorax humicola TaxID=1769758 RepID=A0ABU8W9K5_9BURK